MELKRYSFPFNLILDYSGNEQHQRTANNDDAAKLLDGSGEISPSEHIHQLALAEQDRFQKMTYVEAVERVRKKNPQLIQLYASESAGALRVY